MTPEGENRRRAGIITACSAGDWAQTERARGFDVEASDAAFRQHRDQAHPGAEVTEVTAVRTRRYAATRTLTIINVAVLIVSALAFMLVRAGGASGLYVLAILFPTVPALVVAPVAWLGVIAVAVAISGMYAAAGRVRTPRWPRFYQALAWCGLASVPLGWAIAGAFMIAAALTL